MGNSKSDLSNGAGSSNEDSNPRRQDTATVVAAVGAATALAAAWGLTKLASSSSSSGLQEENNSVIFEGCNGRRDGGDGRLDLWRFPGRGKLKMNTDCSVTDSQAGFGGRAGFGGVIRDESGSWKMGFYGRLKDCSSCEAELLAVYNGLQIIQVRNFGKVFEIESDSEPVVNLINSKTHTRLPSINEKVEECKVMLQRTGCTLKYIGNKANKVADEMAKRGRDQDNGFVTFSFPPDQKIQSLLGADVENASSV